MRETESLGHHNVETEHLLLGLLREDEGVAMRILLDSNLEVERARQAVLEMVTGPDRDDARRRSSPDRWPHGVQRP